MKYIPAALFLLLLSLSGALGAQIDENRRELEEIRRRIEETAKNLEATQSESRELATQLKDLEKDSGRLRERRDALRRDIDRIESQARSREAEIKELKAKLNASEAQVRRRLAVMYKAGETGMLRILFSEISPARAAESHEFLGRIVRRDRDLIRSYRDQSRSLRQSRENLARLQHQRSAALEELEAERQALVEAGRVKERILARLDEKEKNLGARLQELREKAERLSGLVKKLESEKTSKYTQEGGPFARQKGRLPWPVPGRVRVDFGTSRHLGTLRESQGIEIAAPRGQAVSAVWPGKVIFADWFKGFGNLLILDHGDGYYSLYAQNSRLTRRVGEAVQGGETLAQAGHEDGAGLYFEIRHHGIPLDPAEWLVPR